MLSTDSALRAHRQGERGQRAARETPWPCQVFNDATAARASAEGSDVGTVSLAELLPWRAVVFFVNAAGTTCTDRAVFCCRDADDAAERAVDELEERRRTQAHRLGGPDAVRGEAKIVNPGRQTVRRCYLYSADEAIRWSDRAPDEIPHSEQPGVDSVVLAHWQGEGGKCCGCDEDWPCRTLNQAFTRANPPEA